MRRSADAEKVMREWRKKSDWSENIFEYFLINPHKMEENNFLMKGENHEK